MNGEIKQESLNVASNLSCLGIEKFLMPNEIAIYATKGSLYVSNVAGFKGYVTKKRVIFHKSSGFWIFKNDTLNEIPIDQIKSYKMIEEGVPLFKKTYLQLNDLRVKGDKTDVLEFYRAIQTAVLK